MPLPTKYDILKVLLLKHANSGKLCCYAISKGKLYPECREEFEKIWRTVYVDIDQD